MYSKSKQSLTFKGEGIIVKTYGSKKSKAKSESQKETTKKNEQKVKVKTVKGNTINAEYACASERNVFTIGIFDSNDIHLASQIGDYAKNNSRYYKQYTYGASHANEIAKSIFGKIKDQKYKSIVLNLTGSRMQTLKRQVTQEALEAYVGEIFDRLKDKGIYVTKVITSAQPGIALATARVAIERNYDVEIRPTEQYEFFDESGKRMYDKEKFMANLGDKYSGR